MAFIPVVVHAASFEQPIRITDGDTTAPAGMSRSTAGSLLWTRDNKLALIYYDGGQEAYFGDRPSHVWFRQWSATGGWASRQQLSQSYYNTEEMGGRHPCIVERADGTLFSFWHDYRNRSSEGLFDIEIYGDRKAPGDSFSSTDQRLTSSGAVHGGDNGYVPKAAVMPDGRIALVWYDYHWNPGVSEICLRMSDTSGVFGTPPPMDSLRLTVGTNRYDGNANTPFTMPAVAATSGTLHLCWATGTGSNPQLYYGRVNAETGALVECSRIEANAAGYYDPAKIIVAPDGAVWLVYTLHDSTLGDEIVARRKPAGASSFGSAIKLVTAWGSQQQSMAVFDTRGLMHLVYLDGSGAVKVVYRCVDAAGTMIEEKNVTNGLAGSWQRPAVALDGLGGIYVVWEEEVSSTEGRVWFTWSKPPKNAAANWAMYD